MLKRRTGHSPALFCASLGLLAAAMVAFGLYVPDLGDVPGFGRFSGDYRIPGYYTSLTTDYPALGREFDRLGMINAVRLLVYMSWAGALAFAGGAVAALLRKPVSLAVIRKCYVYAYAFAAWYVYQIISITGIVHDREIPLLGVKLESLDLFNLRVDLTWKVFVAVAAVAWCHVLSWRRSVVIEFGGREEDYPATEPLAGDRVLENVRTHGRDPRFRRSTYGSVFVHVFLIFLLPWLLAFFGCVEAYRIPKGSGDPVVTLVKIVKPKKKPKKKYVLNPRSAISFHIPDLDESNVMEEVQKQTELQYQADASRVHGKPGKGGGKKGGWPDGMDKAVVRFIRLEHNGGGWDDGMSERGGNADANFLAAFGRMTGFTTRKTGEAHRIALLSRYPKGEAPPFVYLTGDGSVNIGESERKILRQYLLDGGMLFADAETPAFDRSFRAFVQALFPGQQITTVADDDIIFRQPYAFPNGMPIVAPHGGLKAMGIKVNNRLVVFYSPGDLNDAWKTGSSGLGRAFAEKCMQMGVNVIYYAFTNYLEATKKYRK